MTASPRQSGNVFFYILVAIALLAALSIAISQGSRMSETVLSDEQAKIAAQEIIDYGNAMAATIQKLRLRGCSDIQFDFANDVWMRINSTPSHATGHNPNAPASGCSIFSAADGKIQPIILSTTATTDQPTPPGVMQGHGYVVTVRLPGQGEAAKNDMAMLFPNIKKEVCLKINNILGVTNPSNDAPTYATSGAAFYVGAYSDTATFTDNAGVLSGKNSFCIKSDSSQIYAFWQVLLAR